MTNVKIRAVEVYHPKNQVDNEFYLDHFRKQGKEIASLLKALGREKRYIIDNDKENTLTMGIEAAKRVLAVEGLSGEDIDMIVFSSQLPEYTMPSQALIVHNAIGGKITTICMDSNANCVGMISAMDNAMRYMLSNKHVNRALIIGSDYISTHCKEDDEMSYPIFGDAASAVILEKTEEDCGLIDSIYQTDSSEWYKVTFPACGLSKISNEDVSPQDKKISWMPMDTDIYLTDNISDTLNLLLERNNLTKKDVNALCVTQYAKSLIKQISDKLEIDLNKFVFIGDEYGYTGTSSPLIALYEGIKSNQIKRGDIVMFWSVGINWMRSTILIKY